MAEIPDELLIKLGPLTALVDIDHKRGDTFKRTFTIKNKKTGVAIPFGVGATAKMVFKARADDDDTVLLTWSTGTGEITVGDTDGSVAIVGPASTMNPTNWRKAFYDLEVTHADGTVQTYMSGRFELVAQVAS